MANSKVILNGETLIDLTQDTVTANAMLYGITAHGNDGEVKTGTIASKTSSDVSVSSNTVTIPAGFYASEIDKVVASGSVTPAVNSHSITTTPAVKGALTGTINQIGTTTQPSGTDGTDYWSITPSGTVTATGVSSANAKATVSAGYIASSPANSSTSTVSITPSFTNGVVRYIKKGTITNNTSGGTSSGTINRGSQIKIGTGYYAEDTYYTAKANSGTVTISGSGTTSVDGYANASVASSSITEGTTSVSGTTVTRGEATWGSGWINSGSMDVASFANVGTSGTTYIDISDTTESPVLVSGDYLYIGKGYVDNLKISLAKLVPDGSDVKGHQEYILSGHSAYDNDGNLVAGTIPTKTATNISVSANTVTVPVGYYAVEAKKTIPNGSVTQNAPTVDSSGLVTAKAPVTAGYVSANTYTNTLQLSTVSATTYTPTTTDQTISSGKYTTGVQTIKGDANLLPQNILSGVTIFGVQGAVEVTTLYRQFWESTNSISVELDDDGKTYLMWSASSSSGTSGAMADATYGCVVMVSNGKYDIQHKGSAITVAESNGSLTITSTSNMKK